MTWVARHMSGTASVCRTGILLQVNQGVVTKGDWLWLATYCAGMAEFANPDPMHSGDIGMALRELTEDDL